jgi:hypothetical protein
MAMARKTCFLLVFALVAVAFAPAQAFAAPAPPEIVGSSIPVDADAFYKGLSGAEARAKIKADALDTGQLPLAADGAAADAFAADGLGVGEVRTLYGDGFRDFTLMAIGDNCEIWVANDLSYPAGDPRPVPVVTQAQVDYLFAEFNGNIYPNATGYFGMTADRDGTGSVFESWGLDGYATDNPQRVMILVFNIIDEAYYDPAFPFYTAGYFWPEMNDVYANRNIIHIDSHDWANRIGPDASRPYLYEQVFTHEYEHAIHYDHDPGEPSWVDEGLADLAPYLVGYGHSAGHIAYYLQYHRTPLTVWNGGLEDYGESYLFQLYLLENFGGAPFVKALVDEPANGIEGIENQLAAFGYTASFDDIYRDWTVANYLDDEARTGLSGATLGYDSLDIPSDDTWGYTIEWGVDNVYGSNASGKIPLPRYYGGYKSNTVQYPIGTVMPYGPMYLTYSGMEPSLVSSFRGDASSGIEPFAGDYELWGGRGDLLATEARMAVPVPIGANGTLALEVNYQIEEYWDFAFVQVSTDGGATWASLANAHTTSTFDPNAIGGVIANVPGFTGSSGGWSHEVFDLSAYEGQSILVRFLYITDWATNESGFYADEILITDASGTVFYDGLEAGAGSWVLSGFEHTTGLAANDWALTFLNPVYLKGKLLEIQITESDPVAAGVFQTDTTVLDTSALNRDEVTIIMSNHQPEANSAAAGYRLLVSKERRLK